MRALALAFSLSLFAASAALAAPSCVDRNGDPIHCGVQGAMPVGWSLSAAQRREKDEQHSADMHWKNLAKAFCMIGVLLVGIALLPEFDGADDASWDKQEDDGDKRPHKRS
jgi:hypothetical protein